MARTCSICTHRKRTMIDTLLRAGAPYRDIEARCKPASRSALQRHKRECLGIIMGQITGQAAPIMGQIMGHDLVPNQPSEPAPIEACPAINPDMGTSEVQPHSITQDKHHRAEGILQVVRATHRVEPQEICIVPENPMAQFKQAWYAAKDDAILRGRMVAFIQDELASEDMGLP